MKLFHLLDKAGDPTSEAVVICDTREEAEEQLDPGETIIGEFELETIAGSAVGLPGYRRLEAA